MKFTFIRIAELIAVCLMFSGVARAQFTNSPYSRFGLGILQQTGSVANLGMGGISATSADGISINMNNPATYGYLNRTTFQAGLFGQSTETSGAGVRSVYNNGMVNEIAMAFKRTGGKYTYVFGLTPYSSAGYSLRNRASINDSTNVDYLYTGDGGVNRLNLGINRQFLFTTLGADSSITQHRLQVALQGQYYFGSIQNIQEVRFNRTDFYNTRISGKMDIQDVTVQVGVHYMLPLSVRRDRSKIVSSKHLLIGASYTLGTDLRGSYSQMAETIFSNGAGSEFPIDTTEFTEAVEGRVSLPSHFHGGIALLLRNQKSRTVVIAAEFQQQSWSNFSAQFGEVREIRNLNDMRSFSFGVEYTPKPTEDAKNALGRGTYRIGLRQTDSYLTLRNENLMRQSVTAGCSFPMLPAKAPGSRFHLGLEVGEHGTNNQGLLQERFLYGYIGFTLTPHFSNPWFVVRKYD
jgi:hypothetical protein